MPLPVRGIVAVAELFGMVAGRTSSGRLILIRNVEMRIIRILLIHSFNTFF